MEIALCSFFVPHFEVVAQEVESEFVVCSVCDIGVVLLLSFGIVELCVDASCFESERVEDSSHPCGVSLSEVVVDGDDMDAFFVERIQRGGQCCDQRFSFACFHFGDVSFVEGNSSDDLHIEVRLLERSRSGFAHEGEGLREEGVEGRSLLSLSLEFMDCFFDVGVGELLCFGSECGGFFEKGFEGFDSAFVCGAEEAEEGGGEHGANVAEKAWQKECGRKNVAEKSMA